MFCHWKLRRPPSTDSLTRGPSQSLASEAPSPPRNPPPSLTSESSTLPPSSPAPTNRLRREVRRLSSTYSLSLNPPPSLVSEVPSLPPNPPPSLVSEAPYLTSNPAPSLATGVPSLPPPAPTLTSLPRRGRRRLSSTDSHLGARIPFSASGVYSIPSQSPPPVYQPVHEASRRDKQLRTILRRMEHICQILTLMIPLALVVLVVYVHAVARHSVRGQLNNSRNDPRSRAWAPFWLAITYVRPLTPLKHPDSVDPLAVSHLHPLVVHRMDKQPARPPREKAAPVPRSTRHRRCIRHSRHSPHAPVDGLFLAAL